MRRTLCSRIAADFRTADNRTAVVARTADAARTADTARTAGNVRKRCPGVVGKRSSCSECCRFRSSLLS